MGPPKCCILLRLQSFVKNCIIKLESGLYWFSKIMICLIIPQSSIEYPKGRFSIKLIPGLQQDLQSPSFNRCSDVRPWTCCKQLFSTSKDVCNFSDKNVYRLKIMILGLYSFKFGLFIRCSMFYVLLCQFEIDPVVSLEAMKIAKTHGGMFECKFMVAYLRLKL